MNVKTTFADQCRSLTQDMLTALRTGAAEAYEEAADEARELIASHLAAVAKPATAPEVQDGPVRPGYASAIAAYAAAKNSDQRDRRFDELCLIRADEIARETGDPDPTANLFDLYDIDGQVISILEEAGLKLEVLA
jgi:hypothetical protein